MSSNYVPRNNFSSLALGLGVSPLRSAFSMKHTFFFYEHRKRKSFCQYCSFAPSLVNWNNELRLWNLSWFFLVSQTFSLLSLLKIQLKYHDKKGQPSTNKQKKGGNSGSYMQIIFRKKLSLLKKKARIEIFQEMCLRGWCFFWNPPPP